MKFNPFNEYNLDNQDIERIFSRTGKKELIRVNGFTHPKNKKTDTIIIAKIHKVHGNIGIEFKNTSIGVFYTTLKMK